jgi:hypothetical protein
VDGGREGERERERVSECMCVYFHNPLYVPIPSHINPGHALKDLIYFKSILILSQTNIIQNIYKIFWIMLVYDKTSHPKRQYLIPCY